ncbi:MAG: hypothetical protein WHS88_05845 [Anaerohalosphaeraceae bacterium]
MKNSWFLSVLTAQTVFLSSLFALTLDTGSIVQVNTNEDSRPFGYNETFAASSEAVVWLDERNPSGVPQLYGIRMDDPNRTEFLIDPYVPWANGVKISGSRALYKSEDFPSPNVLRVADIQNPASPQILTIQPNINVSVFDINGPWIAYAGSGESTEYRDIVTAADVSDFQNPQTYRIAELPENAYVSSLALESPYLVWIEYTGEGGTAKIADLTNPAAPSIQSVPLPENFYLESIRVSDNALIGRAWYGWEVVLCLVRDYRAPHWTIQRIRPGGILDEYLHSGPRLDGPFAVWVTTARAPAFLDDSEPRNESGWKLKAVSIYNLGNIVTLLNTPYENEIGFADIAGRQIVWSQEETYIQADLFQAALELECGDWGYKPGDINKDCRVDLEDLACLSRNWLSCTTPDQPDCQLGS